jgi:hypothetical protein
MPVAASPELEMATSSVHVTNGVEEIVIVCVPGAPALPGATIATSSAPGGGLKLGVVLVSVAVV